ncbi:MAG: PSD1 domain-containing protein [Planctomycetes bacterium]|nr:PSD1 domain-containing protein [Planctomycetota bacterium]
MNRLPLVSCLFLLSGAAALEAAEPVSYARDILPILSANCYACHGPDDHDRQAELRLDDEQAVRQRKGSGFPIVPGKPDESLVIARITSADPDLVMPPRSSRRQLTPEQKELLRRWVAEGAKWQRHWSFEPIQQPAGTLDDQVRGALSAKGLALQKRAEPTVLVRRLFLDLIGLPPTPEAADVLVRDPSPAAYERLVDELLARPQFGEHWARMWLDLARFADTKGYEKDLGRTMGPYRDWVIQALNDDMPLDQFTLEQLAGDLLPQPSEQQLIATAFHRNTMCNDEGGTDDEEFRIAAVKDRVDTTIQVWMGLTMGCAKCHSHKYDPISLVDYYRFYAIFNQTEDADRYDDAPRLEVLTAAEREQRAKLQASVTRLEEALRAAEMAESAQNSATDAPWRADEIVTAESRGGATLKVTTAKAIAAEGKSEPEDTYTLVLAPGNRRLTALRLEALPAKLADGQFGVGRNPGDPNFVVSELRVEVQAGENWKPVKLVAPRADFSQSGWPVDAAIDGQTKTGWAVSPRSRERHVAIFDFAEPLDLTAESRLRVTLVQEYGNRLTLGQFRLSTSTAEPATLSPTAVSPEVRRSLDELAAAKQQLNTFQANLNLLPILRELPADKKRVTRVHKRGNFLDPGEVVEPGLPQGFGPLPANEPLNRTAVARWLVNRDNPLTPRVWANRIWARLWGLGLVETEEDFGALGSPPSNPALLDWLAAAYRDQGWSLKKLVKVIVMSQAYQQASEISPALREADPRNQLASRGARYRLPAEVVRDQALAVSGLLSAKMGGPSVMPPQPAGLWRSTYNGKSWVDAEGEDRYRRGIYTYLKRTTPYPALTMFDAGSGEVCQIRRIRTNTPLQALVTLNDPAFLEAAAALAKRLQGIAGAEARARQGLRLALIRPSTPAEIGPLLRLQQSALREFESAPEQASALLKVSRAEPGATPPAEFASWIVTASAILNLDELLTRN